MLLRCKFCNCGKIFNDVTKEQAQNILRVQCPQAECKVRYAKERSEIPEGYRVLYRADGWCFIEQIKE